MYIDISVFIVMLNPDTLHKSRIRQQAQKPWTGLAELLALAKKPFNVFQDLLEVMGGRSKVQGLREDLASNFQHDLGI